MMTEQNFDIQNIEKLKEFYKDNFHRLTTDEERTLEFYYHVGQTRGVSGYRYVYEAIKRASMKQKLAKPISYIASLCKSFYKNGLFAQPFAEENDIVNYIQSKIGTLSQDNKTLICSAISNKGAVRVMAASAEILNNSKIQDEIVEAIILKVVDIFGKEEGDE